MASPTQWTWVWVDSGWVSHCFSLMSCEAKLLSSAPDSPPHQACPSWFPVCSPTNRAWAEVWESQGGWSWSEAEIDSPCILTTRGCFHRVISIHVHGHRHEVPNEQRSFIGVSGPKLPFIYSTNIIEHSFTQAGRHCGCTNETNMSSALLGLTLQWRHRKKQTRKQRN